MNKKLIAGIIIIIVILLGFWLFKKNTTVGNIQKQDNIQKRDNIDLSSWPTYSNEEQGFEVKYPPMLKESGHSSQLFLVKKETTSAERMDYSNHLVEIRVSNMMFRFEGYYQTPDNKVVKRFGDLKIRSYNIGGYPSVEYGYDEIKKDKEVRDISKAMRQGASVGTMNFNRGLIINKNGTIIEISTNNYVGEFKDTFDRILSTVKFVDN